MKYHILRIQALVIVSLSNLIMLNGCKFNTAPIASSSEQKEEIPEESQSKKQFEIEKKQTKELPQRLFGYQEARERYLVEWGEPQIEINESNNHRVGVKITTKNTTLTSVNPNEALLYHEHIYNSPKVMEKFATGVTRDLVFVEGRLDGWNKRFEQGNPFAGLTARLKNSNEFIGNVVLGGADENNSAELAYFLREDRWGQRLGAELVGAVVLFYSPILAKKHFKLPNGEDFERAIATCRIDNYASKKILDSVGMRVYSINNKFGNDRYLYELNMKEAN